MVNFGEWLKEKKAAPANTEPAPAATPAAPAKPVGVFFGANKPAAEPAKSTPAEPMDITTGIDDFDVLDLSDLSETEIEEPAAAPVGGMSSFLDETPADQPVRELPADMDKQQLNFVDLIDSIYRVVHDPELTGSMIKNIMIELKSSPQYMNLVAKEDVRTWIQIMRNNMGVAKIKKQETKAKRAGGKSSTKAIDSQMSADLDALLGGIDL